MKILQEKLSLAILNAYSFYSMGLNSRNSNKVNSGIGDILFKKIPETVAFCFASELFLKVLISQFNSVFEKTHRLRKLFDSLPQGYKDGIKVAYDLISGSKTGMFFEELDRISNAFEEWRYYGVNDLQGKEMNLPFEFAYQFSTVLKNLVLKINPETARLIQSIKE